MGKEDSPVSVYMEQGPPPPSGSNGGTSSPHPSSAVQLLSTVMVLVYRTVATLKRASPSPFTPEDSVIWVPCLGSPPPSAVVARFRGMDVMLSVYVFTPDYATALRGTSAMPPRSGCRDTSSFGPVLGWDLFLQLTDLVLTSQMSLFFAFFLSTWMLSTS